MNKLLLLSGIFLIISRTASAQITAPKYSNEFLSIGVGARAFGMGNVQTAVANDVTAAYWNPAGLLKIQGKYQVALMHSEYFAGIAKYDYAGFATRVDSNSVLAISAIRFGVDDIPDTRFLYDSYNNINYNNIRYFSAADYAFLMSYARKSNFIEGLSLGASFKVIHRTVGNFANSWGFGLDAGAQLQRRGWLMGLMLHDVTGTFNAWTHNTDAVKDIYTQTGNVIPENSIEVTLPRMSAGVGRQFKFGKKIGLLASSDLDFTFDGKRNVPIRTGLVSIDPKIGVEADYKKVFFIRLGAGNVQRIEDFDGKKYTSFQPNFGVGIKVYKFTIDYALTDLGNFSESLYSNVFSLKLDLNK